MTSILANSVGGVYSNPEKKELFFSDSEQIDLDNLLEAREKSSSAMSPCDTNLFIGVFFDGTGNNYAESFGKQNGGQSNVARLYSAYPGQSVLNALPPEPNWQDDFSTIDRLFHGLMSRPAMLVYQPKTLGFRGAL